MHRLYQTHLRCVLREAKCRKHILFGKKRKIQSLGRKGFCRTERVATRAASVWTEAYDSSGFKETHWFFTHQSQLKGRGKLILAAWAQHLATATRPPPGVSSRIHATFQTVGRLSWYPPLCIWLVWEIQFMPDSAALSRWSTSELNTLCSATHGPSEKPSVMKEIRCGPLREGTRVTQDICGKAASFLSSALFPCYIWTNLKHHSV